MQVMYEDETFRREWVLKKKNASMKPPRLGQVQWRFLLWPKDDEDEDTVDWDWDEVEVGSDEDEEVAEL